MTRVHRSRTDWTPEMEAELLVCDNRRAYAERYGLSLAAVDGRYYKLKRASQGNAKP